MAKYIKSLKYKNPQGITSGEITTVNGDVIANITGPNGVTYTRNLSDIDDISMSSHSTISGTSESSPYRVSRTYTVSGGMGDYYRYSISETGDGTATASVSSSGTVSLTISVSGTGTHSGTISLGIGSRGDAVSNGTLAQRTMNKTFSIPYNLKIENSSSVDFPMSARIFLAGPESDSGKWTNLLQGLFSSCLDSFNFPNLSSLGNSTTVYSGIGEGSSWLGDVIDFVVSNSGEMEAENLQANFVFVITGLYDDEIGDNDAIVSQYKEWCDSLSSALSSLGVTFIFIDWYWDWRSYDFSSVSTTQIHFVNLNTLPDQSDWEFLLENRFSSLSAGSIAEFTGGGSQVDEFDKIALDRGIDGLMVNCALSMYNQGYPSIFIGNEDYGGFLGFPQYYVQNGAYANPNGSDSIGLLLPCMTENGEVDAPYYIWSCAANHVDGSANYWEGFREDGWTGEAESTYLWGSADSFVDTLSSLESLGIDFVGYGYFVSMMIAPNVIDSMIMATDWQATWGSGGSYDTWPAFVFVDGIGCESTWEVLGMTTAIDFPNEYVLPFNTKEETEILFTEQLDYISLLVSPGVLKVTSFLIAVALANADYSSSFYEALTDSEYSESFETAGNGGAITVAESMTTVLTTEFNESVLNTENPEAATRVKCYGQVKSDFVWDSSLTKNTEFYTSLKIMPKIWKMRNIGDVGVFCNLPNYCAVEDSEPYFNFRRAKAELLENPPI